MSRRVDAIMHHRFIGGHQRHDRSGSADGRHQLFDAAYSRGDLADTRLRGIVRGWISVYRRRWMMMRLMMIGVKGVTR